MIAPETHWLLDGHRTKNGHALVPGTGFLELARAALRASGEAGPFEIEDLFFIRPLAVADDASDAAIDAAYNKLLATRPTAPVWRGPPPTGPRGTRTVSSRTWRS